MTPGRKYTVNTSAFYMLILPLIPLFNHLSPSGPCNPGFGILLEFLTLLIAIVAFIISLAGFFKGNGSFKGPLLVNGIVLAGMIAFIYTGH
jgi:hypothetical protein